MMNTHTDITSPNGPMDMVMIMERLTVMENRLANLNEEISDIREQTIQVGAGAGVSQFNWDINAEAIQPVGPHPLLELDDVDDDVVFPALGTPDYICCTMVPFVLLPTSFDCQLPPVNIAARIESELMHMPNVTFTFVSSCATFSVVQRECNDSVVVQVQISMYTKAGGNPLSHTDGESKVVEMQRMNGDRDAFTDMYNFIRLAVLSPLLQE